MIRIYGIGVFFFSRKKEKEWWKDFQRITQLILILEVVAFLFICLFVWLVGCFLRQDLIIHPRFALNSSSSYPPALAF